jgi:hypothetical protein
VPNRASSIAAQSLDRAQRRLPATETWRPDGNTVGSRAARLNLTQLNPTCPLAKREKVTPLEHSSPRHQSCFNASTVVHHMFARLVPPRRERLVLRRGARHQSRSASARPVTPSPCHPAWAGSETGGQLPAHATGCKGKISRACQLSGCNSRTQFSARLVARARSAAGRLIA